MLELLIKASTHAVVFGRELHFSLKTTIDCTFVVEIGVYNAVLSVFRARFAQTLKMLRQNGQSIKGQTAVLFTLCAKF